MMTTTYYVVPAGSFFDNRFENFPNREMAGQFIEVMAKRSPETDYGIYEVKLVAGVGKMTWGEQAHVRDGSTFIVSPHCTGGVVAYDDGFGPEDASLYGYGPTPDAAIAECLENIAIAEERRAISATEKMEA